MTDHTTDPYSTPPLRKGKSGAFVRYAIVGALLAGAAWGYMEYGQGPGLVAQQSEEQELADTTYDTPVTAVPSGEPAEVAPSATAPAPATATTPSTPSGATPSGR